ncbi:MAG: tyrosyl-tRNA synthetase [Microgenomates group bacterium LiPW_16]|nr:MAG: tyrosyl-tRNA synthetase [Microgenomates group bacterium LiPW_16]
MDEIDELLTRGVERIYPSREALGSVLRSDKKLRLYQGFDPSMPNLHLGHLVGLLKLRQFQDLGHEVIFLIGDFTGMIGDPTDKSAARPRLTREQVLKNAKNWKEQAGRILNFDGENPAKIMFNSAWNDKITFKNLIEITSNFTIQQLLERDMFQKRMKMGKPIFLHEFLYPVAQAIDCVEMDVDLEVGGSDQTFNMLAGRILMKALKRKEKFVLTTKLLVDSKGEKVGKTAGNALFLNATPAEMYGGIMSFPDEVIPLAFELLSRVSLELVEEHEKALQGGKVNPMDLKKQLAFEIVKLYHGEKPAKEAQEEFERVFQKGQAPVYNILTYYTKRKESNIVDLLVETKLASSRSGAKRLVEQGGVEVDGKQIADIRHQITVKDGMIIRAGKRRFVRLKLT